MLSDHHKYFLKGTKENTHICYKLHSVTSKIFNLICWSTLDIHILRIYAPDLHLQILKLYIIIGIDALPIIQSMNFDKKLRNLKNSLPTLDATSSSTLHISKYQYQRDHLVGQSTILADATLPPPGWKDPNLIPTFAGEFR